MIPILVLKTENKVIYNKSNLNCKTFFEEFIYDKAIINCKHMATFFFVLMLFFHYNFCILEFSASKIMLNSVNFFLFSLSLKTG